jgi:hypothetical protein
MKMLIKFIAIGTSIGFIFAVIGCFKSPSAGMIVATVAVGIVAIGLFKVAAN